MKIVRPFATRTFWMSCYQKDSPVFHALYFQNRTVCRKMKTKTDSTNFHLSLILWCFARDANKFPKKKHNTKCCWWFEGLFLWKTLFCCMLCCRLWSASWLETFVNYVILFSWFLVFFVRCFLVSHFMLLQQWYFNIFLCNVRTTCSPADSDRRGKAFLYGREILLLSVFKKFPFQFALNLKSSGCQIMT